MRTRRMAGFSTRPTVRAGTVMACPLSGRWSRITAPRAKRRTMCLSPNSARPAGDYAAEWIDVQRAEFRRMGVAGEWDNPYTTMAFDAEAAIVSEFLKFVDAGLVYRGSSPVMWSPVEKTALAEAEVEYHDKVSPAIWVKFPVRGVKADGSGVSHAMAGASVVIWNHHALDDPGQPRDLLFEKDQLRPL